MAKEKQPQSKPGRYELAAFIFTRVADSGLLPVAMFGGFLLCGWWLLTRNLASADALKLSEQILGSRSLAAFGWIVAIGELPIAIWIAHTAQRSSAREMERLTTENAKAREYLQTMKQGDLKLETENQKN